MSLAPQQKFMGQIMGPSFFTKFFNSSVYILLLVKLHLSNPKIRYKFGHSSDRCCVYTVKTPTTDPLSLLIPCWKNQPTAEKKNIKKKVIPQCCPHANTN